MRAFINPFFSKNTIESLNLSKTRKPIVFPWQILIKTKAVALNPHDLNVLHGNAFSLGLLRKEGKILGCDVSGSIIKKGIFANKFKKGDKVFAMINPLIAGGFSEYVCLNFWNTRKIPSQINTKEAAAISLVSLTALNALFPYQNSNKSILIIGASGGVGHIACQIALYFGLKVTAVCSEKNRKFVESLGVNSIISYDKEQIGKRRFDIIFDVVNTYSNNKFEDNLNPNGNYIYTYPNKNMIKTHLKNLIKLKFNQKLVLVKYNKNHLDLLLNLIENDNLRVNIQKEFSFLELTEGLIELNKKRTIGKLVCLLD